MGEVEAEEVEQVMAAVVVVAVVTAALAMMLTRSLAAKIPKHLLISWNQISAAETFAILVAMAGPCYQPS